MVTAGILPFRENSHSRAGNRTRDLKISSRRLWPLERDVLKFRNTNFNIFEKFLPVIFHTSTYSVKFSFLFFLPKHIMNPLFSFYWLFVLPKERKPTCSYHMLHTTIHADFCQEWQKQNSKEDPLETVGLTVRIFPATTRTFTKDTVLTVRACQRRTTACVKWRWGMAGAHHGIC